MADTSVVLNLACVGQIELLRQLYHEVIIPPAVRREFVFQAQTNPRFNNLSPPVWLTERTPTRIPRELARNAALDLGEIQAIALALEIRADAVLIDEKSGRGASTALGLRTFGALSVLLQAKAAGFLKEVGPTLDALRRDAGFWCSETLRTIVLRNAGEVD